MKTILSRIILPFTLLKINFHYPILNMLFGRYKKKECTSCNKNRIQLNTLNHYPLAIENPDYYDSLQSLFKKLVSKEGHYFINTNDEKEIFPRLALILNILNNARDAIDRLEAINKDDKRIAHYEKGKNENLDDLIKHYTQKLHTKGTDEIIFKTSRNEIKLKRLLARLKKRHPLLLNYYLAILMPFDFTLINISSKDKDYLKGLQKILEFFMIGHATKNQILKSTAIQIFVLYKDDYTFEELTQIISEIITIIFSTNKPYNNFSDFNKKDVYIKNVIDKFIIFDFNDEENTKQINKMRAFLTTTITNKVFLFKFYPFNMIAKTLIDKPLLFAIQQLHTYLFGIPRTKK